MSKLETQLQDYETANPNECAYFTFMQKHSLSLKKTIEYFDRGCIMCEDGRNKDCKYYIANGTLRRMAQEVKYCDAKYHRDKI
jgi:hypothetical protein